MNHRSQPILIGILALTLVIVASTKGAFAGEIPLQIAANNIPNQIVNSGFFAGIGIEVLPQATNVVVAQGFIAEIGGTLHSITSPVIQIDADDVPLIASIHRSNNGFPGEIIGQMTFPSAEIPTNWEHPFATFDFLAEQVHLTVSESYFVSFMVTVPNSGVSRFGALVLNNGQSLLEVLIVFRPMADKIGLRRLLV